MTIPKIIHYCWFGNGELSEEAIRSLASWKKHLPEYELMEWNEENFDVRMNRYVSEAYDAKKYAYVSDYVRLYALKKYGGVYFDTDIEVLKSFNDVLHHRVFICYEGNGLIGTGTIASESHHPWLDRILAAYDNKKFILENGEFDLTTNLVLITKIMQNEYDWTNEDTYQVLKDDLNVYQSVIFSAKDNKTGEVYADERTYAIHHFG